MSQYLEEEEEVDVEALLASINANFDNPIV